MRQLNYILSCVRVFGLFLVITTCIFTLFALIFSIVSGEVDMFKRILLDPLMISTEFSVAITGTIIVMFLTYRRNYHMKRMAELRRQAVIEAMKGHEQQSELLLNELSERFPEEKFELKYAGNDEAMKTGNVIEIESYSLWRNNEKTKVNIPAIIMAQSTTKESRERHIEQIQDILKLNKKTGEYGK